MTFQEKTIRAADGLKLYVRDYRPAKQTGDPVVCLTGLTRNSQDFNILADAICAQGHRVVTLDYRGRGKSERDVQWTNYNPQVYVSDIFQVCAALGLHHCTFVGTSLGGLLSMAMCTVAPGLVGKIVMNDVGPDLDGDGLDKIIKYTSDGTPVASLEAAVEKLKSFYPSHKGYDQEDWLRVAEKTYRLENGKYVPDWDVKIADSIDVSRQNGPVQDLWPYYRSITSRPLLIVRGDESEVFSQETYEKMLTTLPHAQGYVEKGVGHAPTLDKPDTQKVVLDFIAA